MSKSSSKVDAIAISQQQQSSLSLSSSLPISSLPLPIPSELDNLKENLIKLRENNNRNDINNYKDDDKNNANLLLSIKLKTPSSSSSRPFAGLEEESYQWSIKLLTK